MLLRKFTIPLFGFLILYLAACSSMSEKTPTSGENGLTDTRWTLVSYGQEGSETPVIDGTEVTLQFEGDAQAGGSAGCNTFGARYEISDDNQISVTDTVSTLMACSDENVMEQEKQYLDALNSADHFEITGESLKIYYENGVLLFSRLTSNVPGLVRF